MPKKWRKFIQKSHTNCQKGPISTYTCQKYQEVEHFWPFLAYFTQCLQLLFRQGDSVQQTKNLFLAVTQCDKQNKFMVQWLSATNNMKKKNKLFCGMWQRNWKTKQKQTSGYTGSVEYNILYFCELRPTYRYPQQTKQTSLWGSTSPSPAWMSWDGMGEHIH